MPRHTCRGRRRTRRVDTDRPAYIADGQLEAVRLGRKTLRIKAESVERFIDAKSVGNWR